MARAYFRYYRRRLGRLSRVASRTLHGYVGAALGESEAVPGVISLAQSFGSLAHWTRTCTWSSATARFGVTAASWRFPRTTWSCSPKHGGARCSRCSCVRAGWRKTPRLRCSRGRTRGSAHPWDLGIEREDRASVLRVARYGARAPVAESRLRDDAERAEVELVSDASEGRYAGVHRFAALEFLARRVDHIPAKGEVRVRYYGAYASRRRGWWRRRGVVLAGTGPKDAHDPEHEAQPWPALQARRRRWAELLRMVCKVEVEVCPRCGGEMSIVGLVTEYAVITRILAHLDRRGVEARAGPWAAAG